VRFFERVAKSGSGAASQTELQVKGFIVCERGHRAPFLDPWIGLPRAARMPLPLIASNQDLVLP
jgi:hypothetical protein